ncbi:MAG: NADH-quinone oxidoreductase subunit NuoB [Candidatus Dormiibacterota bacterium]|jgi:formate hydrogenlyase subunit 7
MSRWILGGLRTGIKTTRFPGHELRGEEGAGSTVQLHWQGLTPAGALKVAAICPTSAIEATGDEAAGELKFDAGACIMCGRCVRSLPAAFTANSDPRVAVRERQQLQTTVRWGGGQGPAPTQLQAAATAVQSRAVRLFRHSLHIRHVDAGSCNGCESELQMLGTPYLDLHRLGFFFTPTPRHADALLVTGVVTRNMEEPLLATYAAMPAPKLVIAAGACALSGGSFADGLMTNGPVDRLLPVDVYVPGCPPTPQALLHGLLVAVDRAERRYRAGVESHDGA